MTDPLAERARKIGGTTLRSIGDIAQHQRLLDNNDQFATPEVMLEELVADSRCLRKLMRTAHDVCDEYKGVATAFTTDRDGRREIHESHWKLCIAAGALIVVAQLVRPAIPAKPATAEVQASPAVRQILNMSCYSCHSDERRLAWFDQIKPAYLLVRHDILNARSHLSFSTLGSAPPAVQRATLFEAVNVRF